MAASLGSNVVIVTRVHCTTFQFFPIAVFNLITAHTPISAQSTMGWLDVVKVLFILHHRGVQLILAYSWARLAILAAGKGRGGQFLAYLSYAQDELL